MVAGTGGSVFWLLHSFPFLRGPSPAGVQMAQADGPWSISEASRQPQDSLTFQKSQIQIIRVK